MTKEKVGVMIENYVYLYHTDTLIVVPEYADSITDNLQVNYPSSTVLTRTAPIYSYANSGPRTMQVAFQLHRDMMTDINHNTSNAILDVGEDYVDVFIKQIQAAALPSYEAALKMVNPPLVAVRLGSDIFIKGVVQGGVGVTYKYPIIPGINADGTKDPSKDRYACVDVAFNIAEVDPYDADTVMKTGSYRGLSTTLERKIFSSLTGNPIKQPSLVETVLDETVHTKEWYERNGYDWLGDHYERVS